MEQIKEMLANFDFKAFIDQIVAFLKDLLAKFTGGADAAE